MNQSSFEHNIEEFVKNYSTMNMYKKIAATLFICHNFLNFICFPYFDHTTHRF
ncbi:hypothetical protein HMPREF0497_1665 [Lentilactobacillus buchneri ATCC 11577]|nr:hypothetical protein HMPREF0497_1665 [Lentilactobacillus buchneri ATCC 11577]EEI71029.1 hypothetical protein HMPREF0496_1763 [Lentilactobacillus hilgardii ATCC 27305]